MGLHYYINILIIDIYKKKCETQNVFLKTLSTVSIESAQNKVMVHPVNILFACEILVSTTNTKSIS